MCPFELSFQNVAAFRGNAPPAPAPPRPPPAPPPPPHTHTHDTPYLQLCFLQVNLTLFNCAPEKFYIHLTIIHFPHYNSL